MNGFINWTGTLGQMVAATTEQATGQIELTILMLAFIIIFLALAFRIPLEYTAILILPLFLGTMAYYQAFTKWGGLILFYISIIFIKNMVFNK